MRRYFFLTAVLFAVHCPFFTAFSADLGEIEVTAPDNTTKYDESAASSRITPKAEEARSTTETIEQSPGVFVRRYGSNEDNATISIRGAPANQIEIFYDNVPLTGAAGNVVDLSFTPPQNIGRIEIYRGGTPGRAPDPSAAGAIFLSTPERPEKLVIRPSLSYGSFGTWKGYLQFTQPLGRAWYLFSADHSQSRGDFKYLDDRGTRSNPKDDVETTRKNNDYTSDTVLAKFGWSGGLWKIEASNTLLLKEQGVPGLGQYRSNSARLATNRNVTVFNAGIKRTNITLFFDFLNNRFTDPKGDIGLGAQDNNDDTYRFGEEISQEIDVPRNRLYFSLTHRGEFYLPKNYAAPSPEGSTSYRNQIGLLGEDMVSVMSDRITVTPSLRLTAVFNHLSNNDPSIQPVKAETNESNNYQLGGKIGLKARIVSDLYFKGNFYRGYRNPNFTELFGDRGTLVGNPGLRPEKATNFDAGLMYEMPVNGLLDGLKAEAVYYRNYGSDLIQFLQTSQYTAKAENIGSSLVQGLEASVQIGYLRHLSHSLSYTYQQAKNTSDTVTNGKTIPGRPKNDIWFITTLAYDSWKAYGEYNFMSGLFLDKQNIVEVTARNIINLGATVSPRKWVIMNFTIKNITNDQTYDVIGFPLPGRSYWGGLTFLI